ncbi:MAG TPA: SDR family oxidoreductase [Vicinamibacterales bacterium]|nr:SDR family oxidoreductase [Vicinamibacterales bacterium]
MTLIQTLFGLDGRVALVAGASRGLGSAIAGGLASAGARVTGVGRSTQSDHPAVRYVTCDVTDSAAFARVCDDVVAADGALDIYVHAAGITQPERDQGADTFRATIETNLNAGYHCSQAAAARMTRPGGAIVMVTSIGGRIAFPDNPAYAASKGGLRSLARALALDLAPRGIRVNTIAPGYIRTAMTEASYQDPAKHEQRRLRTMLGRWGTPDDVVGGVIYLVSSSAAYVTGHELVIDGGWTARGL